MELGATGRKVCPIATILSYMANPRPAGSSASGPFFIFKDGGALTRERFVKVAEFLGWTTMRATASALEQQCHGMPDTLMKILGRWESAVYTLYIRTPHSVLCSVAKSLVGASQ